MFHVKHRMTLTILDPIKNIHINRLITLMNDEL